MKQCWQSVGRRETERLYSLSNQRRKEVKTERSDCYSVLNVYFVPWRFPVSSLFKFHGVSLVSFYKFKNLPRSRAGAASTKVHALVESPVIAVDGEQWKEAGRRGRLQAAVAIELGFLPHWSQQMDKKFWTYWRHILARFRILPAT